MVYVLAALVGVGLILSIFTGPIGLALVIPAGIALLLVLRARQPSTTVDERFVGGPQPESVGGHDDPTQANPH